MTMTMSISMSDSVSDIVYDNVYSIDGQLLAFRVRIDVNISQLCFTSTKRYTH